MIIKNKTNEMQCIYLKDGRKVCARAFRTIDVDENVLPIVNETVWDVPKVNKVEKVSKKNKTVESAVTEE
jgi:hypothetical protein